VIRIPFHFTWGSCSIYGLTYFTKPIIWIFHEINSLAVTEMGQKLHGLKTKLYVNYLTMNKHIKVDCRIVKDKILLSIIKTSFLPIFLRATSLLAFGCFCFFKETRSLDNKFHFSSSCRPSVYTEICPTFSVSDKIF
jgi:hypothetical protein